MKIKSLGYTSFKISGEKVSLVTDPIALVESGLTLYKTETDICVFSDMKFLGQENIIETAGLSSKIVPEKRSSIFEIANYGEFEIGEMFIRHSQKGGFYIFDEGYARIVYAGLLAEDFDPANMKGLGDVDVLMLPIGDGKMFPPYNRLEKMISIVDPLYLIPYAYKQEGLVGELANLKAIEDFTKETGFANVTYEKDLKVTSSPEQDEKAMKVIVLQA